MRALEWLDEYGDIVGDGFYAYQSRSSQGLRNQGWKDSSDAIVHEDGSLAEPPISLCEEQAFAYDAKMHMAQLLHWFGRKDEARRLAREASELKRRFNEVYWQQETGFIAMGLDGRRRPIRSIASDPGHCLATGILTESYAARTADRLMQPDMFSGWGIRTLSSLHPAYNPYSYHRGSVWPVEHGAFAIGFMRHGFVDHLHRVCRAIFEAAMLFDFYRLPELFSGHSRDHQHPFPALYPKSNWPQAWSSSALFAMVQALLGLAPFAPLGLLFVDPHLPDWLPEVTLRGLRVGDARIDLRFSKAAGGRDIFEVLDQQGPLKVMSKPSRWSFSSESDPQRMDSLQDLARTG
jgi:glycogen debranching enzyme